MMDARRASLVALIHMEAHKTYSNLMVSNLIEKQKMRPKDSSLAIQLIYGVTERRITLDYIISRYLNRPFSQLNLQVKNVLRLGIYQLLYLNIDDFAAVHETVELVKRIGCAKYAAFVNAILRQFLRDDKRVFLTQPPRQLSKRLSVLYSCPQWLVSQLLKQYGNKLVEHYLKLQLEKPPIFLRVNTERIFLRDCISRLQEEGFQLMPVEPEGACIMQLGKNLFQSAAFQDGLFHIQDISSQFAAKIVAHYSPQSVLDICSAPGGKTFTIAEILGDKAKVTACDISSKRLNLMRNEATRLGLLNRLNIIQKDAREENSLGLFDFVLCDLPCSGFGVVRRKPEIKYKSQKEISALPSLQREILDNASKNVRPGGYLLYSTCTLLKSENQNVIESFLQMHPEFSFHALPSFLANKFGEQNGMATMLHENYDGDGFFVALCKKRKDGGERE